MSLASIGSIATEMHNLIEGIPSAISGAALVRLVDRKRQRVQDYTGVTIGSNSIDIKYQDVIIQLAKGDLLQEMDIIGVDAARVRIGDVSIDKSQGSLQNASKAFMMLGENRLKELGRKMTYYRSW